MGVGYPVDIVVCVALGVDMLVNYDIYIYSIHINTCIHILQ